jgi:hypothetical protein
MNDGLNNQCPRCAAGRLKTWLELADEEREVVLRLPESADYSAAERQSSHRWCTRCWHESTSEAAEA